MSFGVHCFFAFSFNFSIENFFQKTKYFRLIWLTKWSFWWCSLCGYVKLSQMEIQKLPRVCQFLFESFFLFINLEIVNFHCWKGLILTIKTSDAQKFFWFSSYFFLFNFLTISSIRSSNQSEWFWKRWVSWNWILICRPINTCLSFPLTFSCK